MKKNFSFMRYALIPVFVFVCTIVQAQLPSYLPANGLVAWYPFNGNANDESGNGYDGQGQNGVTLCGDRLNQVNSAYEFDGVDDHIAISGQFNAGQTLPDFAIACWFMSHNQQDRILWSKSGFWKEIVLSVNSNNQISLFYAYPNPQAYYGITATTPVTSNNWNHVVVSQVNGSLQLYVNGNLIQTASSNNSTNWAQDNGGCSTGGNFIGMGRYCQSYNYLPFNGKIDDLGFWNRALSAEEINALYTSQAEATCNLGTISTPAATICAGESISLVAAPAATTSDCFTPKVKQAGNQNFGITSTHRDAQGNYYMSGAYSGATTIDGIAVPSIGNRDIFLAKYNSCGQVQWVTRGGSSGDQDYAGEGSHGIASDAAGNIYIVGRYNQAFTFYGANATTFSSPWTSTSNGNHQDGFLVKLNSSGEVMWGASLRGTSNDGFVGVAVDGAGNPVVTGGFNGCCPSSFAVTIFGPNGSLGVSSFGSNYGSGLVVKFDANGNILWKAAVYNRDTGLGSLAIDASNNIYLTASFRSWSSGTAAQFIDASGANNSLFNPGIGLGYLVKLNASGNWEWGTTFGNVGDGVGSLTSGSDVAIDASGNPWVVGYFRGAQATVYSTNGSNLTIPASTNDIGFLISYNASGVAQSFVTRQQSTVSTYYRSLAIANDKIAVAGHFTGANAGLNDILLANYSATGTFIDAQTAGGAGEDYALAIVPAGGSFAVCGSTAGGFILDGVNIPSACTYMWNLGAGQGQASVSWSNGASTTAINVTPAQTTTYSVTFSDGASSCSQDLTVTVNQPSSDSIQATITDGETYVFNGQSLNTVGTYEAVLLNAAGCDSVVTLTLSVEPQVLPCAISASATEFCLGDSSHLQVAAISPCVASDQPQWQLLIPSSAYNGSQINFNTTGFDKQTSKFYSVLKSSSVNQVYCFDLNTNQVSSIPSNGGPGELYTYAFDFTNQRLVATRAGRDAVFALPLSGGAWQQIGAGGFDAESYGGRAFWNPISNRFGYFGGYGYFAMKNWIWESTSSGWVNPYPNNNNCNPAKRNTQFAPDGSGTKLFLFSGQGSCDGNQFASSCSLGSPWQTDVGQYCWLRDLYELDLSNYQFTQILAPNNQSIAREGSFTYDYNNDDFYIIGGYVPSGNYSQNVNNYGNSYSMEVLRFRRGLDSGFTPVAVGGTVPPVPNNSIGTGTSVYDATHNRVIYIRPDGVWALNLSTPCPQSYGWSTGEATPSISVTPTESTTYSVTVTQGTQTCTSDVTITVNQPSSSAIEATITEGVSYDFNGQSLTTAGTYEALLVNAAGCDSTVTLTLSVEQVFDCSILASITTICAGESVTLTSAASGVLPSDNYSLDFPNTAQYSGNAQAIGSTNKDGFNLTGDFTIEFWIKAEGSFYWHLMGKNTFGNNSQGWLLKKPGSNLMMAWTYVPNEFDFHPFAFGQWEHVAICFDDAANVFRYFKNGNLVSTQSRDININVSPYDFVIGHELGTGNWFDGKLDNLRISNVSRYSSNFNPSQTFVNDASAIAMFDFNEGSGNVAQDLSGNGRMLDLFNTNFSSDVPAGSSVNQSAILWSNGSQDQSIVVAPQETTTYNLTYNDGVNVCQDSITITVLPNETYYPDADGDGYGNYEMPLTTCGVIPIGYTLDNTDCNDGDALNYPFASCDDGDACTLDDLIQLDCSCAGLFADSDEDGTCDAQDLCQGSQEPGTPCNDGNECTVNDVIQAGCFCLGTFADADNDGTCDANDLCAGAEAGTACDDNDPCTTSDIILADCSCAGTFADADNDGTCDANDNCAGPEAGTACDDSDPCTENDLIQNDCTCAGTFADADFDGTCDVNDLCSSGPEPGSGCDDHDDCTVDDMIQSDCSCAGVYLDSDADGTCDAFDICADSPEPGMACDDGNPCTSNDTVDENCSCRGTAVEPQFSSVSANACGPYTWNNNTFTQSGTYEVTLQNATGCDSIAQLVLTFGAPTTSSEPATACGSYTWNGATYTQSGAYTFLSTNASGCPNTATLNLTINTPSVAPTGVMASQNSVAAGTQVTLTVQGGSLGTGASWKWYRGACGGTLIGTGSSIMVTANITNSYFVRAEGTCDTTDCGSVTVAVQAIVCGPLSVVASQTTVCVAIPTTLTVTGNLGAGGVWKWYKNGCGLGTAIGTGSNVTVLPTATTTYYVRAEGGSCGITSCMSVTIQVNSAPSRPAYITGLVNGICNLQGVVYTTPAVSGAVSYLWTLPSGATIVSGQGTNSITVNFGGSLGVNSSCGTTSICVHSVNNCGSSAARCVNVSLATAAPGFITGQSIVCRMQAYTYSISPVVGASSYTWSVPSTWQILSGQGTTSISVSAGTSIGEIRVVANNACATSKFARKSVTITSCTTQGMPTADEALQLNVWPNPASDLVHFTSSETQPNHLQIYDMLGRDIYNGPWLPEYDVSGLAGGIYFVRATGGGESVVNRLEVVR